MGEPIEVKAVPIDSDIEKLPVSDKWLAGLKDRVDGICNQYGKPEKLSVSERKKARADLNNALKAIKGERTEMLRDLKSSIKRFESESNERCKRLDDLIATFDAAVKADEQAWRDNRKAELSAMYAEIAPDLVERVDPETGEIEPALVPFDLLCAKYGNEKGAVWLNKTNIQIVRMAMQNAVYDIGENEKSIDCLVAPEDREEVKARYFDTLDIDLAMAEAERLKEHRERIRAMEFARQQVTYSAMPTPEPEPEPEPEPTPELAQEQEPKEVGPHAWVISIPSATREQMLEVADVLRKRGIAFDRIYSGTVEDAFRKEAFGE